ncbi:unnamed protein product [Ixodes pacificus]
MTFYSSRAAPITGRARWHERRWPLTRTPGEKGWGRDGTEHNGRLSSLYASEGDGELDTPLDRGNVMARRKSASRLSGCRRHS